MVYLDYAAATPLEKNVLEAMQPFLGERFANPSSAHALGRAQRSVLEGARANIAHMLGAKPVEIVFTSGSTESAHLAIRGVAALHPGAQMVAVATEHEAVLEELEGLKTEGWHAALIAVGRSGRVVPEQIAAAITDTTVLACVQYVNNETGVVQPIARIAKELQAVRADRVARSIKLPLLFYCDAAQAGFMGLHVTRLGVDFMSMGASKIYGPGGSGFLYVRSGVQIKPLMPGGGQERGFRGGTPNVSGAVGMAAALQLVQADRVKEAKRQAELRDWLWSELSARIPNLKLNGEARHRASGFLNFVVTGASGQTLIAHLDREGFAVATGSACSASHEEPSHVLLALGFSREMAESSLRVTIGRPTTKAELQGFARAMQKVVPRVRHLSLEH